MSDVLALPFDQYQRYRLVADLLARLRGDGAPLTVLDVGGRTGVLREFLPEARVTLVDMEASSEPGLVLGDGSRLPFADRSFDVVAAFDTLEHVPPERRAAFVAECARVARRWSVICGPYEAPRVVEAEQLLQRFMREKLGEAHRYLEEHRHHGLPARAQVEDQLRAAGATVASIGHANLDRWLVLQCLSMYMDYDAALRPLAKSFQRYYNRSLYASDHAEPVYRHAIVAAFDDAPIPTAADLLGPAHAPEGALPPFFELAGELVAFDRERTAWHVERAALRKTADVLRADLEGHHRALELAREDLEGHRTRVGELHLHVAGHEATVVELQSAYDAASGVHATLKQDLDGHRVALADARRLLDEERRGGELARRALTEDLDGHKRVVSALRESLEAERNGAAQTIAALRSEVEAGKQALTSLIADLERYKQSLGELTAREGALGLANAELQRDLQGHRDALAATQADLAGHRRALEQARAHEVELGNALSRSDTKLNATLSLAAGLENSMAQREEAYDRLQMELRSRWRNLKRVFRLR